MQNFTIIEGNNRVSMSRALINNNLRTVMSNNSGTVFPNSDLEDGMLCFRTDQKKLYALTNEANQTWKLIFDLNKTATNQEYVDSRIATRSPTGHNHDSSYYTKTTTDSTFLKKTDAANTYLPKTGVAADSSKLGGYSSSDFVRKGASSAFTANQRLDDGKQMQFGTSVDMSIYSDGTKNFINSTTAGFATYFQTLNAGGANQNAIVMSGGTTPVVHLYANNALRLSTTTTGIKVTGEMLATGTVISNSDRKLKRDIKEIESSLDRLAECRGVEFTMKDTGNRYYGVIAQELESKFPHAVFDNKDENGVKTKAVAYQSLIAPVIEALKEIKTRLERLEQVA